MGWPQLKYQLEIQQPHLNHKSVPPKFIREKEKTSLLVNSGGGILELVVLLVLVVYWYCWYWWYIGIDGIGGILVLIRRSQSGVERGKHCGR